MSKPWFFAYDGSPDRLIRHIILWLGFYILFSFIMSFYGSVHIYLVLNILTVSIFALAYYALRYGLIPRFLKKDKKWLLGMSIAGLSLIIYLLYWSTRSIIIESLVGPLRGEPFQYLGEYLILTLRFFSPAILLLVWEYQFKRKQHLTRIRALQKEKLSTELKFLKAQINPHFLFNTLNNLYSFVVTESPKATDLITRLTGILDYVLNKSQCATVTLSEEVETIEHYLELEKIRYGDRLEVQYHTDGQLSNPISPLILLSIIENAFKHGASGDIENPKVHIDIKASMEQIHCRVWNTKSRYQGELNDEYKKGIGLSNIKRQLKLIYPAKHNLQISDATDDFTLTLIINTAA